MIGACANHKGKSKKVKGKSDAENHILINSGSPHHFCLFTLAFYLTFTG
jgi:hypothetical protein